MQHVTIKTELSKDETFLVNFEFINGHNDLITLFIVVPFSLTLLVIYIQNTSTVKMNMTDYSNVYINVF